MSALRAQPGAKRLRRPKGVTPARWVAWQVVRRTFDDDGWADRAFNAEAERFELDARDRAFAQHLAYGTVQQAKRLDHVIGTVGKRPLSRIDPPVLYALRLGSFELLMSRDPSAHAAVDQAVELVRGVVGERAVAFTNAVLRRAQVDGVAILDALDPTDPGDLATLISFPEWVVRRMQSAFGSDGIDALVAQNRSDQPSALRINTLRVSVAETDQLLARIGTEVTTTSGAFADSLPEARLVRGATGPLGGLIDEGVLLPQSLASMLVAHAVAPAPGERLLDMCAAPGGKTMHLAALQQAQCDVGMNPDADADAPTLGTIVAVELHAHRADSIRALVTRAAATNVEVLVADATTLTPDAIGTFDRVLVDAPCSGLGVLAKRPDARWKRSEHDLVGLIELQRRLLQAAATLVTPGGIVVYSTCTLLPDENEQVIAWALESLPFAPDDLPVGVPEWLRVPGQDHMARTWPNVHGTDGFFIARMRRLEEGSA